jgi:hypothetical protein
VVDVGGGGLNAYFRAGQDFNLLSYFMTLDSARLGITFTGMYAMDVIAGDTPSAISAQGLLLQLLVAGPASMMAVYYEAKEGLVVQRAERDE